MPHHYRSKMCLRWTGSCKTAVVTNTAHKQTNKHTEHIYTRYTCNDLNYVWLTRQFKTKPIYYVDIQFFLTSSLIGHKVFENCFSSIKSNLFGEWEYQIRMMNVFSNWFQSNDQCTQTKVAFLRVGRVCCWWNEHKAIKSADSPPQTGQCDSV